MRKHHQFSAVRLFTLTAAAGFLLLSGGCEDEEAKALADQKSAIEAASFEYTEAVASEDNKATALSSVADKISTAGKSSVVSAPAALMEASVLRDIADLQLDEAATLEGHNRTDRSHLQSLIDVAMRANAISTAHDQFNSTVDRSAIESQSMTAESELRQVAQEISALQGPIQAIEQQNAADQAEVNRLREESARLREQAFDLGELEGFGPIQQAVDTDRKADQIDARMAERSVELLDLQSQLAFAQSKKAQIELRAQAARDASDALDASGNQHAESSSTLQSWSNEVQVKYDEVASQIAQRESQLDTLYADIEGKLSSAANATSSATKGSSVNAARLLKARIQQMEGHVHNLRARASESKMMLAAALLASDGAIQTSGNAQANLDQAQENYRLASESARTAYQAASETLDNVSGSNTERTILKAQFDAAATGETADLSQFEQTTSGSGGMSGGGGALDVGIAGVSSPEALVDLINSTRNNASIEQMQQLANAVDPRNLSAMQQQGFAAMRSMAAGMSDLDSALREKFKQGLKDLPVLGAQMVPESETGLFDGDALLGDVGESDGEITIGETSLAIEQQDGRWVLVPPANAAFSQTAGLEEAAAMQPLMTAMVGMLRDHASRVRSGEFESMQAVSDSLQQAMQAIMMGG